MLKAIQCADLPLRLHSGKFMTPDSFMQLDHSGLLDSLSNWINNLSELSTEYLAEKNLRGKRATVPTDLSPILHKVRPLTNSNMASITSSLVNFPSVLIRASNSSFSLIRWCFDGIGVDDDDDDDGICGG